MSTNDIISKLRREIKRIKPRAPEGLGVNSHFKYEWGLDSLELVELVARLEQDFGILIPDEDLQELISLEATAYYIQARLTA